jgi:glycosyltransferase involved in cell wall biosynthesis
MDKFLVLDSQTNLYKAFVSIILIKTINHGFNTPIWVISMDYEIPENNLINEESTLDYDDKVNMGENQLNDDIKNDIKPYFNYSLSQVTFMLPAYNEEQSIGQLINKFDKYDKSTVLVVDNNSRDRTAQIASTAGADVIQEKKQGKGHAVKKGFKTTKSKFTVMLDADDTYDPVDAVDLLKPLMEDRADVVLGSRLKGKRDKGAISNFNLIGNHLLSLCATILHSKVSDVCTGYWAFNKSAINHLLDEGIDSEGFEIEAEMFSKISSSDLRVLEVPIQYKKRADETKLNSVADGGKIFAKLVKYWFEQHITPKIASLTSFKSESKQKPVKLKFNSEKKRGIKHDGSRLKGFLGRFKR